MKPHLERTTSLMHHMSSVAEGSSVSAAFARRSRETALADAESSFYRGYSWCLNAFPTFREVVEHLRQELNRLGELGEGWQRSEVMTNVFLLSCAIADTVDDYMLGVRFDFSKATALIPGIGPGVRTAEALLKAVQRVREWRLNRVRAWRGAWDASVEEFLKVFAADNVPEPDALSRARTRLTSLLPTDLPAEVQGRCPGFLHAFRTLDLTHFDILTLGRRFIAAFPKRDRPVLVVGLRTAGSYFAPLLRAMLAVEGYSHLESVTIRPKKGLSRWERETLARSARKESLAVIVDEPPGTGATVAGAVGLLLKTGFAASDVVALLPIHPTRREWARGQESLPLSGIRILTIEPEQWHKQKLLEPEAIEARVAEYFAHRNYTRAQVQASPAVEQLNLSLQRHSEEKFHNRLKRIYEVRLEDGGGRAERRYVLAKSVGWGWMGYHAFIAGEELSAFVPRLLGLRDGILYTEWLPQADLGSADENRGLWLETAASYVATRVRRLSLTRDPKSDLIHANQYGGFDLLASTLAQAFGGKPAAFLKRARLQHEFVRHANPFPTLIDAKMRPQEWIAGPQSPLKTDFEHHGLGRKQLNVTDPAYDLAEAILHWGLSEAEEERLINRYIEKSGDAGVKERLFLNKLLAGIWARTAALMNLADGRLSDRAQEFNQLYLDAYNFLTVHTARLCGGICGRPAAFRWHPPLIVMDIDGVLDKQIFGFPSTSAAGLHALSLLHAHNTAVAVNTARPLSHVQEYCRAYGFVGGVAEYGAIAWDAVGGGERILANSESLDQLKRVRDALHEIPGVFLDEGYRCSIRAYTYEHGTTVPLPTLFIRDLMAGQRADRLDFHQTYLDTTIVAKDVDKGKGLLALLDLVGQRDIETIAIGDSEPDLAMFRVATRSFAPSQIPCRSVARLLGCRISGRPYQVGLLRSVCSLLHPDGSQCDRCRSSRLRPREAGPLFWELLEAADQGRLRLLLRALLDPMALRVFAR
jgi:hydroxymethylpyrimidine pyrophosphatase-like HAD family hydrolase